MTEALSSEQQFSSLVSTASHQRMATCMVTQKTFVPLEEDDVVLHEVREGSQMAKDLIGCWPKLNYQDKDGRTALMVALEYDSSNETCLNTPSDISQYQGCKGIAKFLIDKGANLEIKDKRGNTALTYALGLDRDHTEGGLSPQCLGEGREEIAKYLIKKGANVDEKDASGRTILMNQIRVGNKEIVKCMIDHGSKYLVDKGADLDDNDYTALITLTLEYGLIQVGNYMIDRRNSNLDGNEKEKSCDEIWELASSKGATEIISYLLDKGTTLDQLYERINFDDWNASNIDGKVDFLKSMVDKGANVNLKDKKGLTLLMRTIKDFKKDEFPTDLAAEKLKSERLEEIVKYLVDKGANLDEKSCHGFTALMLAIIFRNIETAKYLIDRGANLNIKDNRGNTALMIALKSYGFKYFDDSDADNGDKNDDRIGEENYAFMSENLEKIALYLIDKDANLNEADKSGKTALTFAVAAERTEILKYMKDHLKRKNPLSNCVIA